MGKEEELRKFSIDEQKLSMDDGTDEELKSVPFLLQSPILSAIVKFLMGLKLHNEGGVNDMRLPNDEREMMIRHRKKILEYLHYIVQALTYRNLNPCPFPTLSEIDSAAISSFPIRTQRSSSITTPPKITWPSKQTQTPSNSISDLPSVRPVLGQNRVRASSSKPNLKTLHETEKSD